MSFLLAFTDHGLLVSPEDFTIYDLSCVTQPVVSLVIWAFGWKIAVAVGVVLFN